VDAARRVHIFEKRKGVQMFETSDLTDQIRVLEAQKASLEEAIQCKNVGYSHYLQQEARLYVRKFDDVDRISRITADMREVVFHNGVVAVLRRVVEQRVIDFRFDGKRVAKYVHGRGIEMDTKTTVLFPAQFATLCEALSKVVSVSHDILFGVSERWQSDVRPLMTPKLLSSLYCACAVRWVAGQFPSTPLEDVLVDYVIPRIVFGNEISLDQNKTQVV
jgi:hypothetical protein